MIKKISMCALILVSVAPAQTITRGPSVWENTSSSFKVAFNTSASIIGQVEWGVTPSLGNSTTGPSTTTHAITISGLNPDRFYWYRVRLTPTTTSALCRARTFAASGSDVSFFVFGDSGTGSSDQMRVAGVTNSWNWDLGIITGDVIYPDGQASGFDPYFFVPYGETLRRSPIFPVIGNHDVHLSNGQAYLDNFYLPTSVPGGERYYSFNFGNIHFIGLDANNGTNSTQRTWLQNDLIAARAAGATWIFVSFHQAMYSSGDVHGSDLNIRAQWGPLFELYEVDAVFQGHDHIYERTTVRRDYYPNNRGVVYFVTGTGGAGNYTFTSQSFSAFAISIPAMLKVEVRGNIMRTVLIDGRAPTLGQFIDPYTIIRGLVTPALRANTPAPQVNQTFTGQIDCPNGHFYSLFASLVSAYAQIPGIGLVHLGTTNTILTSGVAGTSQTSLFSLTIPNSAALVGTQVFYQGLTLDTAGTITLTDLLDSRVR